MDVLWPQRLGFALAALDSAARASGVYTTKSPAAIEATFSVSFHPHKRTQVLNLPPIARQRFKHICFLTFF
jgi:hypothetical protein